MENIKWAVLGTGVIANEMAQALAKNGRNVYSVANRTHQKAVDFAKKYNIFVIHDNAYSDIIYDGKVGESFLSIPGAMDIGAEFFSLSKSFNVTGARVSFF